MRKKFKLFFVAFAVVFLGIFTVSEVIATSGFYAMTNELGYSVHVQNNRAGGVWDTEWTTTPRDMNIYFASNVPGMSNYNIFASNWNEHHPTNQELAFFQLHEANGASVTSATADWDASRTTYTLGVTGQDAPYPWSRFWQPDLGSAGPVTFGPYYISLTARFNNPAIADNGGFTNDGDPYSISGFFSGSFVNQVGDTYGFAVVFNKDQFSALDPLDAYGNPTSIYNSFGTVGVPEPATMLLLGFGLFGIAGFRRRFA